MLGSLIRYCYENYCSRPAKDGGFLYACNEDRTTRIDTSLTKVETPVLILRGECDYCIPEVASQYEKLFSNATLIHVENAGHLIWLEKSAVLAEVVGSFLSSRPTSSDVN